MLQHQVDEGAVQDLVRHELTVNFPVVLLAFLHDAAEPLLHEVVQLGRALQQPQRPSHRLLGRLLLPHEEESEDEHRELSWLGVPGHKQLVELDVFMDVYLVVGADPLHPQQDFENEVPSFLFHGLEELKPVNYDIQEHCPRVLCCRAEKIFLIQFVLPLHVVAQLLQSVELLQVVRKSRLLLAFGQAALDLSQEQIVPASRAFPGRQILVAHPPGPAIQPLEFLGLLVLLIDLRVCLFHKVLILVLAEYDL